jgi:hypothetical protein
MIRMQYSINCPAVPEHFDSAKPVCHTKPVHDPNMRLRDYAAACLWAQVQWERERNDGGLQYLENLEAEWQRRNLCSECLREVDHPFMTEVDELRQRAEWAEAKLAGINDAARLPDHAFRLAVLDILEREDQPGDPN